MGREAKKRERKKTEHNPIKKYLIATEGECTEAIYFKGLFGDKHIKLLPTKKGNSSPLEVLKRIKVYRQTNEVKANEVWVVIDRDNWKQKDIEIVVSECNKEGYHFILSNPCFELWLLLHQKNPPKPKPLTCKLCKNELKKMRPGYTKSSYSLNGLLENIPHAIHHAKIMGANTRVVPSTKVYELVEKLEKEPDKKSGFTSR